jgi:site-specific DNA recombinase
MSAGVLTDSPARTKRAFDYFRVSGGPKQTKTDYNPEGLSIGAQREAALDKARELDAEIVGEFSDPGKSAYVDLHKRVSFLEMLDELKRCNEHEATRVDYVIVWSLSRWARNQKDYWQTREMVRDAGAQLVSISEPMVGTGGAAAFFTESIIAAKNQYESMQTSENVKNSIYLKAKRGGTYGWTRLGYRNDVELLPDGRKIPTIALDKARSSFITHAFRLYDSGHYSIPQLTDELFRLGLRSRPRKNHPSQKVGTAALHRILRDPYFAGWIVYKRGKPDEQTFPGRHDALIDQDTFDRVQRRLDEKAVAGERPRKREHYLRGSVFCAGCGSRLSYGVSTGENGRGYAYYFCASRVNRTPCSERVNVRPDLLEDAIQRMYGRRPIKITAAESKRRQDAIRAMVEVSQDSLLYVRETKTQLIASLKLQQQRLIRLHTEEGENTSPDAFRAERTRMQQEIAAAEASLVETEGRLEISETDLCRALELAEDIAAVYELADERTRRGYNQAFFTRIKITARWDETAGQAVVEVAGVELTEPYAVLLADKTTQEALAWVEAIKTQKSPEIARKSPRRAERTTTGAFSRTDISIYEVLAEGERFELSVRQSGAQRFSRPPHSTALPPLRVPATPSRLIDQPQAHQKATSQAQPRGAAQAVVKRCWSGGCLQSQSTSCEARDPV